MTGDAGRTLSLEEERALVERLKSGDTSALNGLWHAYARVIYASIVFPRLPNRDMAEEVVQNTFLKAVERIESYQWQEHGILPWLKTIARNLSMDVHRRHKRAERFSKGYTQHMEVAESEQLATQRPDRALMEQERLQQTRERVRAVLDGGKLNARYHKAIELRLFQELEREQCAEIMGVKVGTFDVLFHRAVKRFEALYTKTYGAPE
ncbi:MAG: hypothetical protein CMH57_13730 [Myxococcales bacterium]|nr:hypothetical protein [Myxococcales bacterium]